jgi:predicted alpha/beta hydrolase family esterase
MSGKILFLHGLEAGLHGTKSRYLKKIFKNDCITPDLQISKFKIWLKNSFIRNILKNKRFLFILISIILTCLTIANLTKLYSLGLFIGIISFIILIIFNKKYLISEAVKLSMDNNIKIAEDEIKKHNPEIIIGSSWGGALLVNLIKRGIWKGNSLIIAPAFYTINKVIYGNNSENNIFDFNFSKIKINDFDTNAKIIVYHSKEDEVISYKESLKLCEKINPNLNSNEENENFFNNFELKLYEKGDHSMDELCKKSGILKNDILNLLKKD